MRFLPSNRCDFLRVALAIGALLIAAYFAHFQDYFYFFRYAPQEGDVVFQSLPHNDLVDAIEGITHSPYSHCGVVLKDHAGMWVVIESIDPVVETPLLPWIKRGRGGDFTAYRLDPKYVLRNFTKSTKAGSTLTTISVAETAGRPEAFLAGIDTTIRRIAPSARAQ